MIRHLILSIFMLSGCSAEDISPLTVTMYNHTSDAIGTAILTEVPEGVEIDLSVEGLSPGFHGTHIHEYGECDPPDFESAGSHYNPDGKKHGLLHPEGAHMGDLPNILADDDGKAEAELLVQGATLTEGKYSLLQDGGTSIVIHQDPDDGMSQPAGDAGERIACGKITLTEDEEEATAPTEEDEEEEEEED